MKKKYSPADLSNMKMISKLSSEDFNSAVDLKRQLQKEKLLRILFYLYTVVNFAIVFLFFRSSWILSVFLVVIWFIIVIIRSKKLELDLSIYFGLPGSGKTTLAAAASKKYSKRGFDVFSNVNISGTHKFDKSDLGKYRIENSLIIIDEASIDFNNRNFKEMPQYTIEFLKYHRHYKDKIMVFSQAYDDMDITFRRLAYNFYFVKKSIIPGVINVIPIRRSIGINDLTKEICDEYKMDPFPIKLFTTKRLLGKKYWSLFDSYETPELPEKDFPVWGKDDDQPTEVLDSDWYY